MKSKDVYANATNSFNYSFSTLAPTPTQQTPTQTQTQTTVTSQTFKDWSSKKAITLNKSKIQGSHTNFPALISFTDPDLKSTSGGGKVASTQGHDIVFATSDDTKLSHEIEKYDPVTGQLIAWVKIPSISSATDTTLNLYFGNSGVGDQQDKANVWDANFKAVYHFNGNGSLNLSDSTSNANNVASRGSFEIGQGKIAGAANNGSGNSFMQLANSPMDDLSAFTIEAWVNHDTSTAGQAIWSDWSSQQSLWRYEGGNMFRLILKWNDATSVDVNYAPTGYANGSWQRLVVTYDGSRVSTYGNGNSGTNVNASAKTVIKHSGTNVQKIGGGPTGSEEYWDGAIDELRLSTVARSADWIKTEYNNQNDPTSFVLVGSTQEVKVVTPVEQPVIKETAGPSASGGGSPSVTFSNTPSVIYSSSGGGGGSTSIASGIKTTNTTTTATTNTTTTMNTGGISLPRDLVSGAKGSDVVTLQNALISMGYLSAGNNTGFYGPLTLAAVRKYQQDKGLGGPGDRGWGNVGPKTRASLAKGFQTTTNSLTPAQKAAIQAQINALLTLVAKLMVQLQALQGR